MITEGNLEEAGHEELSEVLHLLMELDKKVSESRLLDYQPYDYQIRFHNLEDRRGLPANQKFLQAANQIGKTYCAAEEVAMHATGIYPDWYHGIRIDNPKTIQVSGITNETTRDICQAELFGDPEDDEKLGTGSIPKANIMQTYRKPGIPNAFDSVRVKHKNGKEVTIKLKAYEAGFKKFMGSRNDVCWLDEEPPYDIWSQILRSQFARPGSVILATFTPENGITQLVSQINDDIQDGQGLVIAAWEDADHIAGVEGRMDYLLSQLSPHERDMRSKGLPLMGSGLIFPVPDDQIMIEPIPIPDHWKKLNGMDFGWDHPTAVAFGAWDEENDIVYIYDEFSQSHTLPPIVASAIKHRGEWIPCIWPHDGMSVADKQTGKAMKDLYVDEGVNMHSTWFTNPPIPDKNGRLIEGAGGNSVEGGLMNMLTRMETGRLKVFSTCTEFFREKAIYHRKNVNGQSQIVKLQDDVISAVRYLVQSLRHAETEVTYIPEQPRRVGARNW
jgi:phage terminase large subunit-like protein